MKVTTLRLPEDLVEALDSEYAEYEHSNRSEYVRWLLERRERIHENTENTPGYSERDTENTLADRVDDLEARLAAVEDRLHTTPAGEPPLAPRDGADVETGGDHRDSPPDGERGQEAAETGRESEPVATDDVIERIVADVSARWDDDDRLEDRREAARAAVRLMRDRGSLGRTVASEQLLPEYAVEGQNERTWWRQNIRDAVSEAGSYSRGRSEYVWDVDE
jgi:Arc/MetJ-type ribon-helix-helix transcriptional regulator